MDLEAHARHMAAKSRGYRFAVKLIASVLVIAIYAAPILIGIAIFRVLPLQFSIL